MPDSTYVLVLTTFPSDSDPRRFARTLVEERLAACVNVLPAMQSIYRWKANIEEEAEHQLFIKTTRNRLAQLWERVRALHPYDVPEFIVLQIADGNDTYLRWIADSTEAS